ncbi:MAG: hypothetical protein IPJ00_22970 [Saprospirales bacterium]|nr:hypothetical protein [Saprospirales bacterium]
MVDGDTVYYPESHEVEYDQLVYKTAVSIDELSFPINENLALRVYYPVDLDPGEKRPLVVLVHGADLLEEPLPVFNNAEALAKLGFVAASVQYRLCKRVNCLVAEDYPSLQCFLGKFARSFRIHSCYGCG